ncbi:MAG TPA: type VI secretion system ATPase TssH [Blastocatellia bacterium]|nr:type VI secretion system ATPase TssH [Blastocatellia bacterium]
MNVNLKSLMARLNDTCRGALEGAAGLCLSRTNYEVDLEHYLLKLIERPDTDLTRIVRHFEIDQSRLTRDLTLALDRLKTGNARTPALSSHISTLVKESWVQASIEYGESKVRSGHLVLAMLSQGDLARLAREISNEFSRISVETLGGRFGEITAGSTEDREAMSLAGQPASVGEGAQPMAGKTQSLDQFTIDLTSRARAGRIDPVIGRDFEIRQVIDILTRRRQNNPILTGEAGVGKTAVVEGFALRVAQGDVPAPLKNVAVRTLDLGLLQAGAGIKGEFENRLKSVIEEVKASPQPIILFIDEAHTMIGAGGQAGQNDAANLLKPALARGELRTIAATTWAEYKKYFEKDAALARRFQVVKVEEPTEEQAVVMMRGLTAMLEKHHRVRILDEAVADAVKLSHRYISGRQLPDKAVSVLDTASAKVAIGQGAIPPAIEDVTRRLSQYAVEQDALEREAVTGSDHAERIARLQVARESEAERLAQLQAQWEQERELIAQIHAIRERLESSVTNRSGDEAAADSGRAELARLNEALKEVQGETALMQPVVTSQSVAEVISGWTGIPVGKMLADEIHTVLKLQDRLAGRVIGQDHALESISQRIRTARANLTDPRRPVGVFLLVGPSGVGKTETALALADTLYGGERNLVTINMSEYQEAHTVSSLKGSPPGYVGYGEGGVLTEAVRRRPYSVVLLDEVEKAHPDVLELFYQVFDKGTLEDGEGREIDFKNTVILLTSNVGLTLIHRLCGHSETRPEPDALVESLRPELLSVFKPALLGRMVVVPYYPIDDDVMREIVKLQLGRIARRLELNHEAEFSHSDAVVAEIVHRCQEVESGARNVDHILTRTLLPEMSGEFLARMAAGQSISRVRVGVDEHGGFTYQIE